MSFTYGQGSTPAFGASPSSFGFATPSAFGGGASAPLFGASPPAFGASSAPAFGAGSTPSLFATSAAAGSPLGSAVATPAFTFSSSTSFFGASSTPAFGASSASAFGAPSATPLFGAQSTQSLFGAPAAPQQAAASQLVTKDNRPVTHSTKWDDLSPQAQQYLLDLEKIVSSSREECQQLDGEERLQAVSGVRAGMEEGVKEISQNVSALSVRVRSDREEAEGLRSAVLKLLRHTEEALHKFKKTHAWRDAARVAPGQPLPASVVEQLGGPVALPSAFLMETVSSLQEALRAHEAAAVELEAMLRFDGVRSFSASDPAAALASLQTSVANLYDCLLRTAARLQAVDDKLVGVKAAHLGELRHTGDYSDPFMEAERDEERYARDRMKSQEPIGPVVAHANGGHVAPAVPPLAAIQPTGIFGTASPVQAQNTPGQLGFLGGSAGNGTGRRRSARR